MKRDPGIAEAKAAVVAHVIVRKSNGRKICLPLKAVHDGPSVSDRITGMLEQVATGAYGATDSEGAGC